MQEITINLDLPPNQRWDFAVDYRNEINELIACYQKDIEDYEALFEEYLVVFKTQIPAAYLEEIKCIAKYCDYNENQVLFANLYYDIVKYAFACTAFAYYQEGAIWHARNLDWWTENEALKKHTKIFNFSKKGKTVFQSVGWVGYAGVLSGMKPDCFSITLNAIVSDEAPNLAKPVSFLLREVLEGNYSFDSAKQLLEKTPIVCDCLLLLAGTKKNELVVIERTPTTSKTRTATENFIIVTNDYKEINTSKVGNETILNETSCGRYDQTKELLESTFPKDEKECFEILNHPKVKMKITVQQMIFSAKRNKIQLF